MSVGKTPFAQVMELLPWTSFARTAKRNPGNADMHLTCAKQLPSSPLRNWLGATSRSCREKIQASSTTMKPRGLNLTDTVYAMDATTIDL